MVFMTGFQEIALSTEPSCLPPHADGASRLARSRRGRSKRLRAAAVFGILRLFENLVNQ